MTTTIEDLVRATYPALAAGDSAALDELLDPEFTSSFAEGMPVAGGIHRGREAARQDGWWAIGRRYAVRAEPDDYVPCADGRLLVLGRYRGRARSGDGVVDAAFMHLWTARDGRLVKLHQVTDTARWGLSSTEVDR